MRPELRLAIDDGISHCRGDQISAHPCAVLVEIHHLRGVRNATVEAEWIAVLRQVPIERIIGGPMDLVTIEHTSSVARVELLGDLLVDLRLAASVIAHQNHVAETVEDRLLRDALEHGSEQLVRDPDGTGNRFCIVRSVGQHGQEDGIAEFSRNRLDRRMRHEVMAAVRVLGASFLDTAGVDQRRRLARRERGLHFHPGHLLELHQIGLRARRSARRSRNQYQGGGAASDQQQQGMQNRTNAHGILLSAKNMNSPILWCTAEDSTTSLFSRLCCHLSTIPLFIGRTPALCGYPARAKAGRCVGCGVARLLGKASASERAWLQSARTRARSATADGVLASPGRRDAYPPYSGAD